MALEDVILLSVSECDNGPDKSESEGAHVAVVKESGCERKGVVADLETRSNETSMKQ